MIKITFPDGSIREYEKNVTPLQIAESISSRLAADVLVANVNDEIVGLDYPIENDAKLSLLKWDDEEGKHAFWHTSAHLMAEAMQELWPCTQFGIGPAIENRKENGRISSEKGISRAQRNFQGRCTCILC